ncbi:hypothetical protein TYRP_009031 [Tyrophagus putrescentiae]|nr:hypothetical protein TYRP_009031 [Tyrophagus putrescentiae]
MKIIGKLNYDKQQCIIPGKFPLSLNEQIQTVTDKNGLLNVPTSGEWPIFEVMVNPRRLNLNANYVHHRRVDDWNKISGLLPARPVRAQSAPPLSAHRKYHPPSSYLALCEYCDTSYTRNHYYYYPGVVVENELYQNGTIAFYYGLYKVHDYTVCAAYVVAVLNTRMPPPQPTFDYRRRFNKFYHLILCEDWTHSGGDSDEEEDDRESRERKEAKNFQIPGISLPWVKTSRQGLPTISKSLLVQVNKYLDDDYLMGTPYFCRVEVVKRIKIIGKLDYDKSQCIIPGKFPLSLNEQIQNVTGENGLLDIPSSGEWPIFEVLLNPRQLKLNANQVFLSRGEESNIVGGLLPARSVRVQSGISPSPSAHRKRHPPPSYLAFCRYQDTSPTPDQFYYYPGIVVEKELSQNGTHAFYHGLYSDWSHRSSADYDDDEDDENENSESKYRSQESKNLNIGIALPWARTSRLHLPTIPPTFLVPIVQNSRKESDYKVPFFCRVEVKKGVKVVGQLHYEKMECTIPNQFPATVLTGQIASLGSYSELAAIPTSGQWPLFEVLLNPRQLTLVPILVNLRQGDDTESVQYMPARPLLAELPRTLRTPRKRYPAPYLAFCILIANSRYTYFAGVVQEVTQNGTLAFYYGLYNLQQKVGCYMYVMAVLNTQLPPRPIDYRRFLKL